MAGHPGTPAGPAGRRRWTCRALPSDVRIIRLCGAGQPRAAVAAGCESCLPPVTDQGVLPLRDGCVVSGRGPAVLLPCAPHSARSGRLGRWGRGQWGRWGRGRWGLCGRGRRWLCGHGWSELWGRGVDLDSRYTWRGGYPFEAAQYWELCHTHAKTLTPPTFLLHTRS